MVAVDGPSAAEVNGFTLRSADGRSLEFEIGRLELRNGGKPAPHLREHLVSGVPITVEYTVENGRNVAHRYVDA